MKKIEDITPFLAAGFSRTRYQGQQGEFVSKVTSLGAFPVLLQEWANSEGETAEVMANRMVVVELLPGLDRIQVSLKDGALFTDQLPLDSREGRRLLEGSGVVVAQLEGVRLPAGWDYTGDPKRVVLECSEGFTTLDFARRGFASGDCTVSDMDCDPEKYKGAGWRRRLVEGGVAHLKDSVDFFHAQRARVARRP